MLSQSACLQNCRDFAHDQATVAHNKATAAHNENMVAHEEVMFAHEEVMAKLTNLGKAIEAGNALPQTTKKNKHFAIPKAVESHYLGREVELDTLAQAFWPKAQTQNHEQKRFVIHGVGGSGKTQFCSKYAQEYRERFVSISLNYLSMCFDQMLTIWSLMQVLGCFLGRRSICRPSKGLTRIECSAQRGCGREIRSSATLAVEPE